MDGLGPPGTVAQSRQLGRAAVLAMLRVAARCPGAVLDSTWFGYALPLARSLPGRLAEVHCTVPRDLAQARYRARSAGRHACHLDAERTDTELWAEPVRELGLGPVITVDTSGPVDIPELVARLSAACLRGRRCGPGLRPFGDEILAGARLDGAFLAEHPECFLGGGAADVVVAGQPVEAGNLLSGL